MNQWLFYLGKLIRLGPGDGEGTEALNLGWLDRILSVITTIAQGAGAIFLILGIVNWALAYRSRDNTEMTQAVRSMIAGGLMLISGSILAFIKG